MTGKRRTDKEKLKLIMECRASGLSDSQWCRMHGIPPSTMYTWIHRFRALGYPEIPLKEIEETTVIVPPQEVVKLEIVSDEDDSFEQLNAPIVRDSRAFELQNTPICNSYEQQNTPIVRNNYESAVPDLQAAIEIKTSKATFKIANNMNPELFKILLDSLGGVL